MSRLPRMEADVWLPRMLTVGLLEGVAALAEEERNTRPFDLPRVGRPLWLSSRTRLASSTLRSHLSLHPAFNQREQGVVLFRERVCATPILPH